MKRPKRMPLLPAALLLGVTALLAPGCGGRGGGGGPSLTLSYSTAAFTDLHVGFALPVTAPSVGIAATSYKVTAGALPPGFVLDPVTGAISGRPLAAGSFAATITATDGVSSVLASLVVDVLSVPASRFAAVANRGDDTVTILSLDPETGLLRHENWLSTGSEPCAIAASPDGAHLYVTNEGSSNVSAFALDTTSGALVEVPGSPFATNPAPLDVAVDPTGRFAYVLCENGGAPAIREYVVDGVGALTPIAGPPISANSTAERLLVEPLARFVYVTFGGAQGMVQGYAIQKTTGELIPTIAVGAGHTPRALAATNEFLYVANAVSGDVSAYRISDLTGALFSLGASTPLTAGTSPEELAVSRDGTLLLVGLASGAVESLSIAADGTLTTVSSLAVPGADGLAIDHACGVAFALDGTGNAATPISIASDGVLAASHVVAGRLRAAPTDIAMVPGLSPVAYRTRNLYAGNGVDDDLASFEVDPDDGSLTPLAGPPVATGTMPNWAEVHPRLPVLYSVNAGGFSNPVHVYSLDADGAPSPLQVAPQLGSTSWSIHFERSGRFAYGIHSALGDVITFEVLADGMLDPGLVPFNMDPLSVPGAAAIDPSGRFLYVPRSVDDLVHQFEIEPATGVISQLATPTIATGDQPLAVCVDPTGRYVYVACFGTPRAISAYAIDPGTGQLTELATSPFPVSGAPVDLVSSPDGRRVYAASRAVVPNIETFEIDLDPANAVEDGALVSTDVESLLVIPSKIRLSGEGDVLYVTHSVTSGGVETFALDANGHPSSIDFDSTGDTTTSLAVRTVIE